MNLALAYTAELICGSALILGAPFAAHWSAAAAWATFGIGAAVITQGIVGRSLLTERPRPPQPYRSPEIV
jgi:Na+/glutamate symporter